MRDKYTQEEMNEILLRAVEQQPLGREVTREQMESLAAEIGVSLDALRAAEASWHAERLREVEGTSLSQQREIQDRVLFHKWQQEHNGAIRRFAVHLSVFLFFAIMAVFTMASEHEAAAPFLAILIPWSIWLAFNGITVFGSGGIMHEKAFRKWQQARRLEEQLDRDLLGTNRRMVR